ncbi:MAG: integrase core domain-containing protein [Phycisphaeraceae bacterium]
MVPRWLMTLLMLLMESWSARRDAQIKLLLLQVELLRQKLPGDRVILAPEDRTRLLQVGQLMNHQVHDVMGIVSVKTYKRWVREQVDGRKAGRVGRPKKVTASLKALILRLARENAGWGVRRIVGELRKLAIAPSRGTVRRVLESEGILPDPNRHAPKGVDTTWRTFLSAHLDCMVATDFFCKNVWTPTGKRVAYALMFIHLGSRKVFVSPSTYHPTADWIQQQARNVTMWTEDEGLDLRFLIRDRDSKYTEAFDEHFRRISGEQIVKTPFQSPIANSFAESWIGSLKRECLNAFWCFSLRQVDYVVQTYVTYHNTMRPHQAMGNVRLNERDGPKDEKVVAGSIGPVRRTKLLGGLLNHYERKAA